MAIKGIFSPPNLAPSIPIPMAATVGIKTKQKINDTIAHIIPLILDGLFI